MSEEIDPELIVVFETLWKFVTAVIVFFMQAGFAMLEAGVVQRKNLKNILIKNVVDSCFCGIFFYLCGYAFAYGCKDNVCPPFIGDDSFALSNLASSSRIGYANWFFQYVFATTAATIVSGSVAERIEFVCYCIYATVISAFIYPVVAHWVWGRGWLWQEGMIDFAGCAPVHMVGGGAGLVATMLLGPRKGRFEGERFHVRVNEFPAFSSVFSALGVMILWFGWLGFNCGSVGQFVNFEAVVELIIVNTTLAPVGATIVGLIFKTALSKFQKVDLDSLLNCCLAGLVSVTSSCATVEPGFAFLIGCIGAFIYIGASELLKQLKIDDPLDAVPIHLGCGTWGLIAAGLFSKPEYVISAFNDGVHVYGGLFYGGDNPGHLIGWQIVTIIAVAAWTCGTNFIVFGLCHKFNILRVDTTTEMLGIDQRLHAGDEIRSVVLDVALAQHAQGPNNRNQNQHTMFVNGLLASTAI